MNPSTVMIKQSDSITFLPALDPICKIFIIEIHYWHNKKLCFTFCVHMPLSCISCFLLSTGLMSPNWTPSGKGSMWHWTFLMLFKNISMGNKMLKTRSFRFMWYKHYLYFLQPHSHDNRALARDCKDVKTNIVYIRSCTGGKTKDFLAATILP